MPAVECVVCNSAASTNSQVFFSATTGENGNWGEDNEVRVLCLDCLLGWTQENKDRLVELHRVQNPISGGPGG